MNRRFRLLLAFARLFPGRVIASIVLGFSSALFNGVNTTLLVPILLQLVGQSIQFGSVPPLIQRLLSPFEAMPEQQRLILLLTAAIVTILLKNITSYINTLVNVSLRRGLLNQLRSKGFDMLFAVDIDFYNQYQVGDIIRQVNGETSRTAGAIINLIAIVNIVLNVSVFTVILLAISWPLTLISLGLVSVAVMANQIFISRAKALGKELTVRTKEFSVRLLETLNGIRLIRSVATEDWERQRIIALIHAHEKAEFRSQMNSAAIGPINEITSILVLICIVLIGRFLFRNDLEGLSTILLVYLVALFRLLPFLGQLNQVRNGLANTAASVELIDDFLRWDNKPFMSQGHHPFQGLEQGITFKHLGFKYPGRSKTIIHDVNLTLPRGKTLALVGSSGSGKSTLINLLARFYDPVGGHILVDDRDLRELELGSFRRRVGLVSQDTFLFNDSVRNNIAYARMGATDSEIQQAAQRANALEFIEQLPQGWDTHIGDRGVMLSGGQRQRLAIARALLQDPDILLLDEATSALDTVSERLVQQALEELSRDRTVLVVAHRLSTIRNADQIAVMDQGRVVEVGTHGELLQRQGKYAQLWNLQFGEPAPGEAAETPLIVGQPSGLTQVALNQMFSTLEVLETVLLESELGQTASTQANLATLSQEAYGAATDLLQVMQGSEQKIAEFAQTSYQARTYLSSMIGSLQLVIEGITDSWEEEQELIQEAYQAGTGLLELLHLKSANAALDPMDESVTLVD